MPQITFSSCFYVIKSKFDPSTYVVWMNNFLSIVKNFNLVIYTDAESAKYIQTYGNPRIKIVQKPFEEFHCYKYKDKWIQNHEKNVLLNHRTCWELNMLWSEKVNFVYDTVCAKYFETEFYGWCDIGYFRNRNNDTNTRLLGSWPSEDKIMALDKNKIHYALVNNDKSFINSLCYLVNNNLEVPPNQTSIAGGFFISHKERVEWWKNTYYSKLDELFNKYALIKDDQIIIANCVFSSLKDFQLYIEKSNYDNWFMFQRVLLD